MELDLGRKYGVHLSSILRGKQRYNIPQGSDRVFPGDKLQVIGTDEQLQVFVSQLKEQVYPMEYDVENREMLLRQLVVTEQSCFCGKTIRESGLRSKFHCMVVGLEQGEETLRAPNLDVPLKDGDVVWIVGEVRDLKKIMTQL